MSILGEPPEPSWHESTAAWSFVGASDYVQRHGERFIELRDAAAAVQRIPPASGGSLSGAEPVVVHGPREYCGVVGNGVALSGLGCVIAGRSVLIDDISVGQLHRHDVADSYVIVRTANGGYSIDLGRLSAPKIEVNGLVGNLMLHRFGIKNYFHFLFDAVGRLVNFEQCDLVPDFHILAAPTAEVPQYDDLLDRMKCRRLYVPLRQMVKARRLLLSSGMHAAPIDLRAGASLSYADSVLSERCLLIRDRLMTLRPAVASCGRARRLFLARRENERHRLRNETSLHAAMAENGFVQAYPRDLSIPDQIALMNDAEIVVVEAGAAASNLLFCRPGTTVILLACETAVQSTLWATLATIVGVRAHVLLGAPCADAGTAAWAAPFTIDPASFAELLRSVIAAG